MGRSSCEGCSRNVHATWYNLLYSGFWLVMQLPLWFGLRGLRGRVA